MNKFTRHLEKLQIKTFSEDRMQKSPGSDVSGRSLTGSFYIYMVGSVITFMVKCHLFMVDFYFIHDGNRIYVWHYIHGGTVSMLRKGNCFYGRVIGLPQGIDT